MEIKKENSIDTDSVLLREQDVDWIKTQTFSEERECTLSSIYSAVWSTIQPEANLTQIIWVSGPEAFNESAAFVAIKRESQQTKLMALNYLKLIKNHPQFGFEKIFETLITGLTDDCFYWNLFDFHNFVCFRQKKPGLISKYTESIVLLERNQYHW